MRETCWFGFSRKARIFFINPVSWRQTPWSFPSPLQAFLWVYPKLIAYLLTRDAFLLVAILSNGQNCHLHTGDLNGRMKYKTPTCPANLDLGYISLHFQSRGKVTRPAALSHVSFSYSAFMLCDPFLGMLIFYSLLSLRKPWLINC